MEQKDRNYPVVNYIVSLLVLAGMGYLSYMAITSDWGFVFKLILLFIFDGVVSLQVMFLALSMGKRDKNPDLNFKPVIGFNIFMLVVYALGFIAYHVYFIMVLIDYAKMIF